MSRRLMRFLPVLGLSLLALFSSGCAVMKVSVAENRRMGVVALIPDKVQTKYVGLWAFSNKGKDADVPHAQFSQSVTAATVDALRARGIDAVPLKVNAA